jgi:hypothetical protein
MAITTLYTKYFQKSKVFLYPLLEIKKGTNIIPSETYLSWNDEINPDDAKLVCLYPILSTAEYINFKKNILLKHTRLHDLVQVDNETLVVIFDFSDLSDDWSHFVNGRYSKINDKIKRKILNFFEKSSGNYMYVESYLFPDVHFENYAKLLDVEIELLQTVGELCSIPDLDKEKLLIKVPDLQNIKILD